MTVNGQFSCPPPDNLKGNSFADLVIEKKPRAEDFHDHQRADLEFLTQHGIVAERDGRIQFADAPRFRILEALHHFEAVNYYRFSPAGQATIDTMVANGWLETPDPCYSKTWFEYRG